MQKWLLREKKKKQTQQESAGITSEPVPNCRWINEKPLQIG